MTAGEEFELYLSDGFHITSSSARFEDFPVDPDTIDVAFEESVVSNPPGKFTRIFNWLLIPLFMLVLLLYLKLLNLASKLGLTDKGVIEELESRGADVVVTDENYHRLLASERVYWGLGHWGLVLISFFGLLQWIEFVEPASAILYSLFSSFGSGLLLAYFVLGLFVVIWFLLAGLMGVLFFVVGTTQTRNYVILNRMEEYAKSHPNAKRGCLVIGGAHTKHLKKIVGDSELIVWGQEGNDSEE